jgi:hypothetical protein
MPLVPERIVFDNRFLSNIPSFFINIKKNKKKDFG